MFDTLIIGAGVIGANVARELSQYNLKIAVLEKNRDVCEETSKANSGIVHGGYDATPGTLKAAYNLRGNRMMADLCRELDVPFRQNGSLVLAFKEEEKDQLEHLLRQGLKNGVKGLSILDRETVLAKEPALNPEVVAALDVPTGGIVEPFQLTIAASEVAAMNGVQFFFETKVLSVIKTTDAFLVRTKQGDFHAKTLVNCAGVYADEIHNQLSKQKTSITPRKGEYCLFDKQLGNLVNATIFQLPTDKGKGVLVTPSVEGNLLIGPSSVFVADKEDTATTPEGIRMVLEKARQSVKDIPTQFIITGFAGLRATEAGGDFILGEVKDVPGLFACVGIESPGLTSAPAIALDTATWVAEYLKATKRIPAIRTRKNITRFAFQTVEKQKALFQENPDYGKVICRCELVTLAEIKASIHRPLGAKTLDGVKRRTQAGTGRCQGGFCSPKIMQILGEELRLDPLKITKFSDESTILVGVDKDWL